MTTANVEAELREEDARLGDQLPRPTTKCGVCVSTRGVSNVNGQLWCKPCRILFAPIAMVLSENHVQLWAPE